MIDDDEGNWDMCVDCEKKKRAAYIGLVVLFVAWLVFVGYVIYNIAEWLVSK